MKQINILYSTLLLLASFSITAKNDANCPTGSYLRYCDGCTYNKQTNEIRCATCPGDWGQTHQLTSIKTTNCKPNDDITTSDTGNLICNSR